MTPLAHRIVKELTLPIKDRTLTDQCGMLSRMDDIHCFEVSKIHNMAGGLAEELHDRAIANGFLSMVEAQTFLPAPKTWIEWAAGPNRYGCLLVDEGGFAKAYWAVASGNLFATAPRHGALLLTAADLRSVKAEWPAVQCLDGQDDAEKRGMIFFMYAVLAIINTPRMIGRRQLTPHRGLERKLSNARCLTGKFPLHAWTELQLSVSAMMKEGDGSVHEAHYTGEKCLHFCRAHIRIKRGRLELVKAHWRGDPSLGIKRTRYILES